MYQGIFIAEKSPHLLLVIQVLETLFLHGPVFFHHGFCHDEFLDSVFPWIQKSLVTDHAVSPHRVGYLKGRVYQNPVCAPKLLGIHTSHGCTDNEVRFLFLLLLMEQMNGFVRING